MRLVFALAALTVLTSPATAERNLVPTLESTPDVCVNRPSEPEWMQEISPREAYKRVLVQDIYRAQNLGRIVQEDSCACDVRYPSWDTAETTFNDNYGNAERWEMLDASNTFNRRASVVRAEALAICKAEGNW